MSFELLVAIRYLKAKRKQAVISLITIISIVGVAAGVAALVVALAINEGFREDLQKKLLGAQAHVQLLSKGLGGIANYAEIVSEVNKIEGVLAAAPAVYLKGLISSDVFDGDGVAIKGVLAEQEGPLSALSENMVKGSLSELHGKGIVLGQELAKRMAASVGDKVRIQSTAVRASPMGPMSQRQQFTVVGIFESGLYDLDSTWVYVPLDAAQRLRDLDDVASTIEVKVRDIDRAPAMGREIVDRVGHNLDFKDWTELNRQIFHALKLERLVMFITIGLIVLVAALNIVGMLIMMVVEKTRDIAILMSMGATEKSIRRIFIYQGVIIGVIGTIAGLILGHAICSIADVYKVVELDPNVYGIAYVPFKADLTDSLIIAAAAILISFFATLYPSAAASKLLPVEALRYE